MSSRLDEMTETGDKMSGESLSPDNFICIDEDIETNTSDGASESNNRVPIHRTRSSTKSTSPTNLTVYTPDELASYRLTPLSAKWPSFLDESFKNARGFWDPDRWHQNRKRGSTPPPELEKATTKASLAADRPTSSLSADGKSRRDPKERIKADQQDTGIVLSPQRRSFLTGCQGISTSGGGGSATQLQSSATSNNSKKEEISLRPDTSRRVGSGRILGRERERGDPRDNDEQGGGYDRDRDNRRFDRRGDDRYGTGNGGFRVSESNDELRRGIDPRRRNEDDPRRATDPRRRNEDDPRRPADDFRRRGDTNEGSRRRGDEEPRRRVDLGDDPRRRIVDSNDRRGGGGGVDRNSGIDDSTSTSCGDPIEDARRHAENEKRRIAAGEPATDSRRNNNEDRWYSRRDERDDFNGGQRRGMNNRDDRGGRGGGRYGGGSYREAEEPEWMSTTCVQGELMELRGFDDSPEKEVRGQQQEQQGAKKGRELQLEDRKRKEMEELSEAAMQHQEQQQRRNENSGPLNIPDQHSNRPGSGNQLDQGFNIDDILHLDVIPGLAGILDDDRDFIGTSSHNVGSDILRGRHPDPEIEAAAVAGSRFSQFFQRPIQPQPAEPKIEERRSSIQDELCVGASILREINQGHPQPPQPLPMPTVRIPSPGDPSAYFAPISPAAKTTNEPLSHHNSIMNMLRVGAAGSNLSDLPPMPCNTGTVPSLGDLRGKNVRSVEELEADIKQLVGISPMTSSDDHSHHHQQRQHHRIAEEELHLQQQQQQQQHLRAMQQQQAKKIEMSAFEKFAAMIGNVEPPLQAQAQQQNILQFANQMGHQQQNHHREVPRVNSGGLIRPSPLPANAPTEQEILAGMIGPRPSAPPNANLSNVGNRGISHPQNDLLSVIFHAPFNSEVLKRPEARALQSALAAGHVTLDVLLQHFAHGNMPPLQREILLNILKVAQSQGHLGPHQGQGGHLPNRGGGLSPLTPPDTLAILQQQHQRLSPGLMGSGGGGLTVVSPTSNQRIPSPQELTMHAQQIMQNALIKRKLEEQKENFRRRQEGQILQQESTKVRDSPLAFTPTAVMKKIAADRRDSDPTAVGKMSVPELKVSQSSEKENGGVESGQHFNRQVVSPNQSMSACLNMIPPGSGMLPMPSLGGQQQQQHGQVSNQLLLIQQQQQQQQLQQQRMRMQQAQAMHQLAAMQQATSPTSLLEQQRLMMYQQQQMQQQQFGHQQLQHLQSGFGRNMQQQHQQQRGPIMQQQQQQPGMQGLSRFFSPEVLAQATSGNAPAMPPLPTQKALTLEEIERQAAAVRI